MSRKKDKTIEHTGVVDRVDGRRVWVRIVSAPSGECGGCSLGDRCGGGAARGMTVGVDLAAGTEPPAVGTTVKIIAAGALPAKAATFLMGIPLVIFTVLLVGAGLYGADEVLALLLATGAAVVFLLGAGLFWRRRTVWRMAQC